MKINTAVLTDCAGQSHASIFIMLVLSSMLVACGGGSSETGSSTDKTITPIPPDNSSGAVESFGIGGEVTGLSVGEFVIKNNQTEELRISSKGQFVFPTRIPKGAKYEVSLVGQPTGQRCTVRNGNGIVNEAVKHIRIDCDASGFYQFSPSYKPPVAGLTDGFQLAFYSINANCDTFIPTLKEVNGGVAIYGPNYGVPTTTSACATAALSIHLKLSWLVEIYAADRKSFVSFISSDLNLRPLSRQDVIDQVTTRVNTVLNNPSLNAAVANWYIFPEESRPWRTSEDITSEYGDMAFLKLVTDTIRATEIKAGVPHRPIASYQPGNRDSNDLAKFAGLLDIVNKGSYTSGVNDPNRANIIYEGMSVNTVGSANATKFLPIAGLRLASDPPVGYADSDLKKELINDVYLSAVAGARGVWIWSYAVRTGFSASSRDKMANMYADVFKTLNVTEPNLGRAMSKGEMIRDDALIPILTSGRRADLYVQEYFYAGHRYFVAVNGSGTNSLAGKLNGWPANSMVAELNPDSDINFKSLGAAADIQFSIEPRGVRVWRMNLP